MIPVCEVIKKFSRQWVAEQFFDGFDERNFFWFAKGESLPFSPSSSSPSNSVHVVFGMLRDVIVNHMSYVGNVQSP